MVNLLCLKFVDQKSYLLVGLAIAAADFVTELGLTKRLGARQIVALTEHAGFRWYYGLAVLRS